MPWLQTGASHYHAQLGLSVKGYAIKGLVFCYLVWLGSMIYEMGLWTCPTCVVWSINVVRLAIEPKYHNSPQIHTDTYIHNKKRSVQIHDKTRMTTVIRAKLNLNQLNGHKQDLIDLTPSTANSSYSDVFFLRDDLTLQDLSMYKHKLKGS